MKTVLRTLAVILICTVVSTPFIYLFFRSFAEQPFLGGSGDNSLSALLLLLPIALFPLAAVLTRHWITDWEKPRPEHWLAMLAIFFFPAIALFAAIAWFNYEDSVRAKHYRDSLAREDDEWRKRPHDASEGILADKNLPPRLDKRISESGASFVDEFANSARFANGRWDDPHVATELEILISSLGVPVRINTRPRATQAGRIVLGSLQAAEPRGSEPVVTYPVRFPHFGNAAIELHEIVWPSELIWPKPVIVLLPLETPEQTAHVALLKELLAASSAVEDAKKRIDEAIRAEAQERNAPFLVENSPDRINEFGQRWARSIYDPGLTLRASTISPGDIVGVIGFDKLELETVPISRGSGRAEDDAASARQLLDRLDVHIIEYRRAHSSPLPEETLAATIARNRNPPTPRAPARPNWLPEKADEATFHQLGDGYSADATHLFYDKALIEGADPSTFVDIGGEESLAFDRSHAYRRGTDVDVLPPSVRSRFETSYAAWLRNVPPSERQRYTLPPSSRHH